MNNNYVSNMFKSVNVLLQYESNSILIIFGGPSIGGYMQREKFPLFQKSGSE